MTAPTEAPRPAAPATTTTTTGQDLWPRPGPGRRGWRRGGRAGRRSACRRVGRPRARSPAAGRRTGGTARRPPRWRPGRARPGRACRRPAPGRPAAAPAGWRAAGRVVTRGRRQWRQRQHRFAVDVQRRTAGDQQREHRTTLDECRGQAGGAVRDQVGAIDRERYPAERREVVDQRPGRVLHPTPDVEAEGNRRGDQLVSDDRRQWHPEPTTPGCGRGRRPSPPAGTCPPRPGR